MPTQEDVFQFFCDLSFKLNQEGYPILDNLRHEFPGIPSQEEILEDKEENEVLQELVTGED